MSRKGKNKNERGVCGGERNIFEFELCNDCTLECKTCLRYKLPQKGRMKVSVFKKILDFVEQGNYKEIFFSGHGDVFLHKKLFTFIDLLFEKYPEIKLVIPTKGQSITPEHLEKFKKMKSAGRNITICFSIFSLEKERLESLTALKYESFLDIIRRVREYEIDFVFDFLLLEENIAEWENFSNFAAKNNVEYGCSVAHNWNGEMPVDVYKKHTSDMVKNLLQRRSGEQKCEVFQDNYLFFDFLGNIRLCSIDLSDSSILGDVRADNYIDIIKRKERFAYHDNCKECHNYKYHCFVRDEK